jgi:hypothetical protein
MVFCEVVMPVILYVIGFNKSARLKIYDIQKTIDPMSHSVKFMILV